MQRVGGWELLSLYHALHPFLPVLIMSADPLERRPDIESMDARLISKPVDATQFETEVSRLITHLALHTR